MGGQWGATGTQHVVDRPIWFSYTSALRFSQLAVGDEVTHGSAGSR